MWKTIGGVALLVVLAAGAFVALSPDSLTPLIGSNASAPTCASRGATECPLSKSSACVSADDFSACCHDEGVVVKKSCCSADTACSAEGTLFYCPLTDTVVDTTCCEKVGDKWVCLITGQESDFDRCVPVDVSAKSAK